MFKNKKGKGSEGVHRDSRAKRLMMDAVSLLHFLFSLSVGQGALCACPCVFGCLGTFVHMHVGMETSGQPQVSFFRSKPPCFLRRVFSLEPKSL